MTLIVKNLGPTGVEEVPTVLGETTNNTSAQPLANGGETKPCISETVTESNAKDNESSMDQHTMAVKQQTPAIDGHSQADTDKPKKKKKKTNFMKRGPTALVRNRGTGFEDYFCDPPMTPEEAAEEKNEIYKADRPFVDRIEECIKRYRARRRMDSPRANLFDKYLALGGIDTTPRMFQGMKTLDVAGATKSEIRDMTAGDVIHRGSTNRRYYNASEPELWDVDFAGVAAGYFSERIFKLAGTDLGAIKLATDVVENFLNYILHHDVCPEYADNVNDAKAICQDAVDQITRCFRVIWEAPGDFSIACLALFDHGKRRVLDPDRNMSENYNMPVEHAQRIFYASLGAHTFLFEQLKGSSVQNMEVVDEVKQAFEVVDISEPDEKVIKTYLGMRNPEGEVGTIKPCGKLTLKPIQMEDGFDKGSVRGPAPGIGEKEDFILDWSVLEHMTVGMKLKLTLCMCNTGWKFIKAYGDVRPRYYTFLAQELMITYKEPVPNERPAPSVENPDVGTEGGQEGNLDE
ncbi:hypothetical protein CONLIGDRAFT_387442 [Coniochaeta ligniaria NRRL 30616]|uniref:Argonaute siRNA chaperone complex subunit Arb1 n=1 Tax=Coniochaeta ligniaria NRRL 30616 TaxID=1408157 RepID=A0A1J7JH30_9PEZI|nr:hypothetical protein CONLIGDRAFT_387442 [Coniochaeta ligniaria NRRL 30616]